MSKVSELKVMLKPGCRAHLVGIGGVSMYPLAEMLLSRGLIVSGSDMRDSDHLAHLRSQGVTIHLGHFPENIQQIKWFELCIRHTIPLTPAAKAYLLSARILPVCIRICPPSWR